MRRVGVDLVGFMLWMFLLTLAAPAAANDEPPRQMETVRGRVAWTGDAVPGWPAKCRLAFRRSEDGDWIAVEVWSGKFVARLPGPGEYRVLLLSIDEIEPLGVCELAAVSVREQRELQIAIPRPTRPVLRLLDRATGAALPQGRVVVCPPEESPDTLGEKFDLPPPGIMRSKAYAANDQGFVRLPTLLGRSVWYAYADMHAWKAVWVSHEQTEPLTVLLSIGGAIEVDVEGRGPLQHLSVTLERDGQTMAATPESDKGRWVAVGLPPGSYRILVLDADSGAKRGEGAGRAQAATVTRVRMVLSAAPTAISTTVLVAGTEAWSSRPTRLYLRGADDVTQTVSQLVELAEVAGGGYRGDLVQLPPGRYDASIYPLQWCSQIVLRSGEDARLSVPAPQTITLRLVDADSMRTITAAHVSHGPCLKYGSPVVIPYDSEAHAFVHQFAPGQAELFVLAGGYRPVLQKINVDGARTRELMVKLRKK